MQKKIRILVRNDLESDDEEETYAPISNAEVFKMKLLLLRIGISRVYMSRMFTWMKKYQKKCL